MQIFRHTTSNAHAHGNVQTLPTQLVVLQRERGVTSFTHNGRHGDLPDSEVTVLLLGLLFLLDVQRRVSAGRWDQLDQMSDREVLMRYRHVLKVQCFACTYNVHQTDKRQGDKGCKKEKEKILTINLLVPFKLSTNSLRAVLSFSLASLLDFFPLPFPFFPFFPLPFFLELCFSCTSSFTLCSFLSSLFFPPCLFFPSSTVESGLQQNGKKHDFDVNPALKKKSISVWYKEAWHTRWEHKI